MKTLRMMAFAAPKHTALGWRFTLAYALLAVAMLRALFPAWFAFAHRRTWSRALVSAPRNEQAADRAILSKNDHPHRLAAEAGTLQEANPHDL